MYNETNKTELKIEFYDLLHTTRVKYMNIIYNIRRKHVI